MKRLMQAAVILALCAALAPAAKARLITFTFTGTVTDIEKKECEDVFDDYGLNEGAELFGTYTFESDTEPKDQGNGYYTYAAVQHVFLQVNGYTTEGSSTPEDSGSIWVRNNVTAEGCTSCDSYSVNFDLPGGSEDCRPANGISMRLRDASGTMLDDRSLPEEPPALPVGDYPEENNFTISIHHDAFLRGVITSLTVESEEIIADAGPDFSIAGTPLGAMVALDGSRSHAPNGVPVTYTWREGGYWGTVLAGPSASPTAEVFLCVGQHIIELIVADPEGNTDTDTVLVTVTNTAGFLSISGRVTNGDYIGTPFSGVVVTAWRPDGSVAAQAVTAANGFYSMYALPAGTYTVTADKLYADFEPGGVNEPARVVTVPPTRYGVDFKCVARVMANPTIKLELPNGGESWEPGQAVTICWTAIGINSDVTIELSRDGGATYETLFANTASDDQEPWVVTGPPTELARMRVTGTDWMGQQVVGTSVLDFEIRDIAPPAVVSLAADPDQLWPANGKLVPVTVVAEITDDAPSGVASAALFIDDEYDQLDGEIAMEPLGDDIFAATVLLRASRNGRDRDGRVYSLSVSAADAAGNISDPAAATTQVVVPHSQQGGRRPHGWLIRWLIWRLTRAGIL